MQKYNFCYNIDGDFMRLRNIKNKHEIIENSNYIIHDPYLIKGKWHDIFKNDNPIYIEIGMGKGKFIFENAKKYKNINFIGIEKFDTVIVKAIKKIENDNLDNLKLVRIDASELSLIFDKEIDLIYLNFSDPWPKDRHSKRRLTHENFLKIYDYIFKNKRRIIMKTDNRGLFEYSVVSISNYGYVIKDINIDLHNSNECDIITTEYEDKFVRNGNSIYKFECEK